MTHAAFSAEHGFSHLKLGKRARREDPRTLKLAKYLNWTKLPLIPDTYVLTDKLTDWGMYDNDKLGNCTCAAAAHMIMGWSTAVGATITPTVEATDTMYWETGDPAEATGTAGGPTDDGRDELSVLNYFHSTGLGGDKIFAFAEIDPEDHRTIRAAIYFFGGAYIGVQLPITAQNQEHIWAVVGDGKTGPSAPGSWGGHAIPEIGYSQQAFNLVTWGAEMEMTQNFHDTYVDEAYAIISPDFLTKAGVTPEGFDMEALQADLAQIQK